MDIAVREQKSDPQATRLMVVDCDIHPQVKSAADLHPYLPERWRKHMATYSNHVRQALQETLAYPRMTPDVARRDAWPTNGGPPGSDLEFMRQQHLDLNGVEYGVLIALRNGGTQRNVDYGSAICRAVNDWQVEHWLEKEPRLRGSLAVHPEDPVGAVK